MEATTSILTPSEQRLLKRYYIYAGIDGAALCGMFVSGFLMLLFIFINDVFLGNKEPYLFGICAGLALTVLCAIAFVYMYAVCKLGTSGKRYQAILEKVKAHQEAVDSTYVLAGVSGSMAGKMIASHSKSDAGRRAGKAVEAASTAAACLAVFSILGTLSDNLTTVMEAAGMAVPNLKKHIRRTLLAPVLVLCLVFLPELFNSFQTAHQGKEALSTNWHYLYNYFEEQGLCPNGADPDKYSSSDGSFVSADLITDKFTEFSVRLSEHGTVEAISYQIRIDAQQDKSESVRMLQDRFAEINQIVRQALDLGEIPTTDPRLLEFQGPLLDEFLTQYEASSYYTPIKIDESDPNSDYFALLSFETKPEDDAAWADSYHPNLLYYISCYEN